MTEPRHMTRQATASDSHAAPAAVRGNPAIREMAHERIGKPLVSFWRWWSAELHALLPAALRNLLEHSRERIVVEFDQQEVRVSRHNNGNVTLLSRTPVGPGLEPVSDPSVLLPRETGGDTIVCLPRSEALQTTLSLPVEAAENIREVLGYEIDRQTPFKSDQVYFHYRILDRNAETRRMAIRLTVIPRRILDAVVSRVRAWGLQPAVVTTADYTVTACEPQGAAALNLLPADQRRQQAGPWTILNGLLAVSAVGLAVAAIVLPLFMAAGEIRELEARVEAGKADAETTRALAAKLERLIPESRFIVERKQQAPAVIEVINELSMILPDDTWLQRMQLNGSRLTIHGESAVASALISVLENSPMFRNATFITVVARNPKSGQERFQITADIVAETIL